MFYCLFNAGFGTLKNCRWHRSGNNIESYFFLKNDFKTLCNAQSCSGNLSVWLYGALYSMQNKSGQLKSPKPIIQREN